MSKSSLPNKQLKLSNQVGWNLCTVFVMVLVIYTHKYSIKDICKRTQVSRRSLFDRFRAYD